MNNNAKKQIVILGAGFGGIKAAFSLYAKLKRLKLLDKYEIILVDKNAYHTYTPTLYEIATTSKAIANHIRLKSIVTYPLAEIFKGKNIRIVKKSVMSVDLIGGDIHFKDNDRLKFNYLILALGSEINYFNIPGLEDNALTLKSFQDAIKLRDFIWNKVDSNDNQKEIKIVIGGGGSTGVELAGELKSWLYELDKELKRCKFSVKIIDGAPSILNGFDEKIVKKVFQRLKDIGVGIVTNEIVDKVEPEKIILKSGQLVPYDILIWAGGTKAVNLTENFPLQRERSGKIQVFGKMECLPQSKDLKLYGKIYGLGDAICFYDSDTNRPIPQVVEAAIDQAKIVSYNITEDIKFTEKLILFPEHKTYAPNKEFPYIIPVGGKYAVAKFGPIIFWGFPAWVLKGLVELYYLLFNVMPPLQAFKIWIRGLLIFIKNDRLG
ncbi:MAG: FAD-dependent oxidoreductase [bacterium]|nr:FAD-dependent oxidoreductase [bacterium]